MRLNRDTVHVLNEKSHAYCWMLYLERHFFKNETDVATDAKSYSREDLTFLAKKSLFQSLFIPHAENPMNLFLQKEHCHAACYKIFTVSRETKLNKLDWHSWFGSP